jgi:hypothetical protein
MVWITAIVVGARTLLIYENTPAEAAEAASRWPSHTSLARSNHEFTLVLFVHPNCPCTRASIAELELIMAQLQGRLRAFAVFDKPASSEAEVKASSLWPMTSLIPGVSSVYDSDGVETKRFGGKVSGQTMLYGPDGKLVFCGGLTSSRGHQGYNEGAAAVVRLVRAGASETAQAPVFGCSLFNPTAKTLREDRLWKQ